MKKFVFSAVAMMAFSLSSMANTIDEQKIAAKTVEIEKFYYSDNISIGFNNSDAIAADAEMAGSLKCWAFGKWLRLKLSAVSNDEELINATVEAAVAICNVLDELDMI